MTVEENLKMGGYIMSDRETVTAAIDYVYEK